MSQDVDRRVFLGSAVVVIHLVAQSLEHVMALGLGERAGQFRRRGCPLVAPVAAAESATWSVALHSRVDRWGAVLHTAPDYQRLAETL
jgi:hypothetical protein